MRRKGANAMTDPARAAAEAVIDVYMGRNAGQSMTDALEQLRAALDAPDPSDELAEALRRLQFAVDCPNADIAEANEMALSALARHDAAKETK